MTFKKLLFHWISELKGLLSHNLRTRLFAKCHSMWQEDCISVILNNNSVPLAFSAFNRPVQHCAMQTVWGPINSWAEGGKGFFSVPLL